MILFGLTAVALGLVAACGWRKRRTPTWWAWAWAGPVFLIALGGYLALAGHRSHLYQSNIRLTAHLARRLRARSEPKT